MENSSVTRRSKGRGLRPPGHLGLALLRDQRRRIVGKDGNGRRSEKSSLEVWVVPITLAFITALAGLFATIINSQIQDATSTRTIRTQQITTLATLRPVSPVTGERSEPSPDYEPYLARLVNFGPYAVPLLLAEMTRPAGLGERDRSAIERSLLQLGRDDAARDIVAEAMLVVIEDPLASHGVKAHTSALRVLGGLRFPNSGRNRPLWGAHGPTSSSQQRVIQALTGYTPAIVIDDWESVVVDRNCAEFLETLLSVGSIYNIRDRGWESLCDPEDQTGRDWSAEATGEEL